MYVYKKALSIMLRRIIFYHLFFDCLFFIFTIFCFLYAYEKINMYNYVYVYVTVFKENNMHIISLPFSIN